MLYYLSLALLGLLGYAVGKLQKWIAQLDADASTLPPVTLVDPDSTQPLPCPSILDPACKSLSVVVPAYNEEGRLAATLTEVLTYLKSRRDRQGPQFTYEVVVVDDGSKDATVQVALQFVRQYGVDSVRVLKVAPNRGKGHAVKRGMLVARGEYCLLIDADGATRFSDLERLEAQLERTMAPAAEAHGGSSGSGGQELQARQGPLGAAFGSRAHLSRAAAAKRSPLRNFLTWGFHLLVLLVAGGHVKDTQCGFKLFSRRAAAVLFLNQRLQRFSFDVELAFLADRLAVPLAEVPVTWTEMPGSKVRASSVVHMAMEMVVLKLAYQVLGTWRIATEAELSGKRD